MDNIRKFPHDGKPYLEVLATSASQVVLEKWLFLIASELELEQKTARQLLIVVDEIFSNIIKYAKVEPKSLVKIEISHYLAANSLELKFIDKGIAYNPLEEAPIPDINAPLEERAIGGLGIFMVKKMMDGVEYKREGSFNIFILRKNLKLA